MSENSNQNNPANFISRIKSNKMLLGGIIGAFLVLSIIGLIFLGIFIGTGNISGFDQEDESALIALAVFQTMQADESNVQGDEGTSKVDSDNNTSEAQIDSSSTPVVELAKATTNMNLNCRFGPNQVFRVIVTILEEETVPIAGRNDDSSWYYVEIPNSSYICWVWSGGITIIGDQSKIMIVDSPPLPNTATPTPITSINPIPTLTPKPTSSYCSMYDDSSSCYQDIWGYGCHWDYDIHMCVGN